MTFGIDFSPVNRLTFLHTGHKMPCALVNKSGFCVNHKAPFADLTELCGYKFSRPRRIHRFIYSGDVNIIVNSISLCFQSV